MRTCYDVPSSLSRAAVVTRHVSSNGHGALEATATTLTAVIGESRDTRRELADAHAEPVGVALPRPAHLCPGRSGAQELATPVTLSSNVNTVAAVDAAIGTPRTGCVVPTGWRRDHRLLRSPPDGEGDGMATPMVLSEDEALELVAFLVTAARTQVDEAAEYGPLRLLTAAGRLADAIIDRVSPETRAFLAGPLRQVPDLAVRSADPAAYAAALDVVCRATGAHLATRFDLDPNTP